MKKICSILILLVFAAVLSEGARFNRIIYPIETTDASGYKLKQYQPPQRIISGSASITDILLALNLKDKLVGVSEDSDLPSGVRIEKVGKNKLNPERTLKLMPDIVIVPLEKEKRDLESLRKLSFSVDVSGEARSMTLEVFTVDPQNLKEAFDSIDVIGTITNKEHSAYSLTQRMRRRMDWITARAMKEKRLKVLVLLSKRPLTVTKEGILADLARSAGLINVAPGGKGPVRLTRDEITRIDPDIIIASSDIARRPKDIYNDRNFRRTGAGRKKMAVCVNIRLLQPGPRLVEALEEIANSAYGWPQQGRQDEGDKIEQNKE